MMRPEVNSPGFSANSATFGLKTTSQTRGLNQQANGSINRPDDQGEKNQICFGGWSRDPLPKMGHCPVPPPPSMTHPGGNPGANR
jgi:hypothetical protein